VPLRKEEESFPPENMKGAMSYLRNPQVHLPIAFLCAIPLLEHQVLVLNEEVQLLGCFMVFAGTVYTQFGDVIGKALDAKQEAVIAEHNAKEAIQITATRAALAKHQSMLTTIEDMKMIYATQDELLEKLAKARFFEAQYELRNDTLKAMDFMANQLEQNKQAAQSKLASEATRAVLSEIEQNKELKSQALTEALNTIADPSKGGSEDFIGKLYSKQFKKLAADASRPDKETKIEYDDDLVSEIMALRKRLIDPSGISKVALLEELPKTISLPSGKCEFPK